MRDAQRARKSWLERLTSPQDGESEPESRTEATGPVDQEAAAREHPGAAGTLLPPADTADRPAPALWTPYGGTASEQAPYEPYEPYERGLRGGHFASARSTANGASEQPNGVPYAPGATTPAASTAATSTDFPAVDELASILDGPVPGGSRHAAAPAAGEPTPEPPWRRASAPAPDGSPQPFAHVAQATGNADGNRLAGDVPEPSAVEPAGDAANPVHPTTDEVTTVEPDPNAEYERAEAVRAQHTDELQHRWLLTQAQLLDDPRDAVREAGLLINDALAHLTSTFSDHRDRIDRSWKDDSGLSTDDLREIMRRYRSMFQYVISVAKIPE